MQLVIQSHLLSGMKIKIQKEFPNEKIIFNYRQDTGILNFDVNANYRLPRVSRLVKEFGNQWTVITAA